MDRHDFLCGAAGAFCSAAVTALEPSGAAGASVSENGVQPRDIGLGPQLFLDQFLIDRIDGYVAAAHGDGGIDFLAVESV